MYDTIIVGAGSAGCALAYRLSADPGRRVLLLEAGRPDNSVFVHMPAGLVQLIHNRKRNWCFETEPVPALGNRRLFWPRGKMLGGSSSLNGMVYIRGHAGDYDDWAALGNRGWGYRDVLPYFKKSEHNERGADDYHGVGGPLNVADLRYHNPVSEAFIESCLAAGLPANADFNGARQDGFGFYQVNQKDGRRCSSAVAFLRPALGRRNLSVVTGAHTLRVLVEGGRAQGVEYLRDGVRHAARADSEVILCGGTVNSPQLLLLSGIGPADELTRLGIPVVHDLPGVGRNLRDHLDVCTVTRATQKVTFDAMNRVQVALEYALTRRGPGSSNVVEAGGFTTTEPGLARPDIQFHILPALLDDHGRGKLEGYGYSLHACLLRPASIGHITLHSADPLADPAIHPNFLAEPADLRVLVRTVKLSRELLAGQPLARYRGEEIFPGAGARTDAEIEAFVRRKAEVIYHPVGTCKMGRDGMAVVDDRLRVRGITGLCVADASIMPTLIGGNTHAPAVMIAEKCADFVAHGDGAAAQRVGTPEAAAA